MLLVATKVVLGLQQIPRRTFQRRRFSLEIFDTRVRGIAGNACAPVGGVHREGRGSVWQVVFFADRNEREILLLDEERSMDVRRKIMRNMSQRLRLLLTVVMTYAFQGSSFAVSASICGAPSYDSATDSGIYLWADDCGTAAPTVNLTALAGGASTRVTYSGSVTSSVAVSSVVGISLEANDIVDALAGNQQIDYLLNVSSPWYDGFHFAVPSEAKLCFGADLPQGTQVHVGPSETAIATPFDMDTLGPCAAEAPAVCGAPTIDSSTDTGLYLWADNCDAAAPTYSLRAFGNGGPTTATYIGSIASTAAFGSWPATR